MRNINYIWSLFVILCLISCKQSVQGQDWDDVKIEAHALTDNVYMLSGQGGNMGVLINDDHVLVIDSQFEPLFDKIVASVAELTDKPIRYLVNTHWHRDHVGGNIRFDDIGATLIAHDNVKTRLISGGKVEFFGSEIPPQPREALPDLTFSDDVEIDLGSETVHIIYVANAHTDGDAIIHFPKNNAIHMGDAYFAKMYPFFDLGSGGKIRGLINACDVALELCDSETRIIPGHGPLSNSAELRIYRDMLKDIADQVENAKNEGATLKEVDIISKDFMDTYESEFGGGFIDSKTLISFIYNSL